MQWAHLRRVLIGLTLLASSLLPFGLLRTALAQDATPGAVGTASGDVASLVDIGGRSLYLNCMGEGSPTVILEAGLDSTVEVWSSLMPKVAAITRVCAYDRANLGASDSAPKPRTGQDAADDLHALLTTAGVPGPYVLVAASVGGIYDRLFAHTYPDEVAGLVLLDPTHEDEDAHLEEALGPELWGELVEQGWFESREDIDFAATSAQIRHARAELPLPTVPVVLLSAGQPSEPLPMPDWPSERVDPVLLALQEDLSDLVPGERWIVVEESGHNIQWERPEVVLDAIRDVVDAVRDPSTWATPVASPAP
jgi:pimeloyl-ACP methyl ester carboxylesterase